MVFAVQIHDVAWLCTLLPITKHRRQGFGSANGKLHVQAGILQSTQPSLVLASRSLMSESLTPTEFPFWTSAVITQHHQRLITLVKDTCKRALRFSMYKAQKQLRLDSWCVQTKDLQCHGWWSHVSWRCGQPPPGLQWSGLPKCWCRPVQHHSVSALLSGGQGGLPISAAGPPGHPWKGGSLPVRLTASQAVPHSSKVEQWPGDERTETAIKHEVAFITGSSVVWTEFKGSRTPPQNLFDAQRKSKNSDRRWHCCKQKWFATCNYTFSTLGLKRSFW